MEEKKIICWDLDESLGSFSKISEEIYAKRRNESNPHTLENISNKKIKIAYALKDVLTDGMNNGYDHVITTSSRNEEYVQECLERSNLKGMFSKVYLGNSTRRYYATGKSYADVARDFNIDESNAGDRIVAIGDAWQDRSCDLENLVFLNLRHAFNYDSKVFEQVIDKLNEVDPTSFYNAFEMLKKETSINEPDLVSQNEHLRSFFSDREEGYSTPKIKEDMHTIARLSPGLAIGLGYEFCNNKGIFNKETGDFEGGLKSFNGPVINLMPAETMLKEGLEFD